MDLDLSFLGWTHTLACMAALALGGAAFLRRKGSPAHRGFGRAYLISAGPIPISSVIPESRAADSSGICSPPPSLSRSRPSAASRLRPG